MTADTPDISPSQIDLYRSCPRKFAFTYLTGRPKPPPKPSAQLGTKCHSKVEAYFNTGIPDYSYDERDAQERQAAKVLGAVLPFLPKPGPGVQAEGKVRVEIQGIVLAGRLDWSTPTEVGDLKTCGSFRYVPKVEDLRLYPQPVIYSLARPGRECHWLYAPTSGAEPRPLRFWADMDRGLDQVLFDAYKIRALWESRPDPNQVEAKPGAACEAYGGCPFKVECGKSPIEKLGWTREENVMSLDDFMAKLAKKTGNDVPKTEAPAAPAQALPPVEVSAVQAAEAAAEAVAQDIETAAPEKPAPKKRQRRVSPPEALTALTPAEAPSAAQDEAKPLLYLFVNCLPVKGFQDGNPVAFSDMVARASERIKASDNVDHWNQLPYGTGGGALTKCIVEEAKGLTDAIIVLDTALPEGMHVVNALLPLAANVIRGLR